MLCGWCRMRIKVRQSIGGGRSPPRIISGSNPNLLEDSLLKVLKVIGHYKKGSVLNWMLTASLCRTYLNNRTNPALFLS